MVEIEQNFRSFNCVDVSFPGKTTHFLKLALLHFEIGQNFRAFGIGRPLSHALLAALGKTE